MMQITRALQYAQLQHIISYTVELMVARGHRLSKPSPEEEKAHLVDYVLHTGGCSVLNGNGTVYTTRKGIWYKGSQGALNRVWVGSTPRSRYIGKLRCYLSEFKAGQYKRPALLDKVFFARLKWLTEEGVME